jgi:hypothetical protein
LTPRAAQRRRRHPRRPAPAPLYSISVAHSVANGRTLNASIRRPWPRPRSAPVDVEIGRPFSVPERYLFPRRFRQAPRSCERSATRATPVAIVDTKTGQGRRPALPRGTGDRPPEGTEPGWRCSDPRLRREIAGHRIQWGIESPYPMGYRD